MKTNSYIQSLVLSFAAAAFVPMTASAQAFPTTWSTSQYDYSKGERGRMEVINYSRSRENKAYIFAANVLEQSESQDLFRLTCEGVSTFNSPYPNSDVTVNFYSNKNYQGQISGSQGTLRISGHDKLTLGIQDHYSLVRITPQQITFTPDIYVDYNGVMMRFGTSDNAQYGWIGSVLTDDVVLGTNRTDAIVMDGSNQTVGIGVPRAEFKKIGASLKGQYGLFVKKGVLSENFSIAPISSWSDFVFDAGYSLRPLDEVESFISENKHLPDVPSAQDIATNGYSQHEMNVILLQKIEELTLYTIRQQKEIAELKARLAESR